MWGRCKATSVDRCPYCASIYAGDAKTIIRAGVWQCLEAGFPVTFLTLTPPSMWWPPAPEDHKRTHRLNQRYWHLIRGSRKPDRKELARERARAICDSCTRQKRQEAKAAGRRVRSVPPVIHSPEDPLAGLPVFLDAFDYDAAAEWNWGLGERWARTAVYAKRLKRATLQRIKAREVSRRGVVHIHALIDGEFTPDEVQELIAKVNASYPDPRMGWGPVADVQILQNKDGRPDGRQIGRTSTYVAKYVTKSAADGVYHTARDNPHARQHLDNLRDAAYRVARREAKVRPGGPCPEPGCPGTQQWGHDGRLRCSRHNARTDRCGWTGKPRICWYADRFGIRSQPITKSRRWAIQYQKNESGRWEPVMVPDPRTGESVPTPLTFTALRQNRQRYVAAHHPRTSTGPWRWIPSTPETAGTPWPPSSGPIQPNAPPPTSLAA